MVAGPERVAEIIVCLSDDALIERDNEGRGYCDERKCKTSSIASYGEAVKS
jgi:hypothetical protein